VQLTKSFPLLAPWPTTTPLSCTTGLVRSTSTQTCGRSPICGGRSPKPTPLRATSVKPYTPSRATGTVSGDWIVSLVNGGSSTLLQFRVSSVTHSSSADTPDGPFSLISKLRLIFLLLMSRRLGSRGAAAGAWAGGPASAGAGVGGRPPPWALRLTL